MGVASRRIIHCPYNAPQFAIATIPDTARMQTMNPKHASPPDPASTSSPTARLALAWHDVKGLVQDHALLAVLEVQRASLSLVKMVAAAIIISILLVSAWMGIVAALVAWAVGSGASWGAAIAVAALVNIAIAVALGFWAKSQIPDLLFAATLRQLRRDAPEDEHAPSRSVA